MQEDVAFLLLRLARAEAQAYVDWKLQLADDGVARPNGATPDEGAQRGFFGRAWHAVF